MDGWMDGWMDEWIRDQLRHKPDLKAQWIRLSVRALDSGARDRGFDTYL